MPDACTLYCKKRELSVVVEFARDYLDRVEVTGPDEDWSTLTAFGTNGATVRLSSSYYRENADPFTERQYGIWMWVDGIESSPSTVKEPIAARIEACELILGVVAEPDFDSDGRFSAMLLHLADCLDGLIFDGSRLMDCRGRFLISSE